MKLRRTDTRYVEYGEGIIVHELANIAGDVEVGPHTRIDAYVTITGNVRIGAHCHIGPGVCIFGAAGVTIGDECSLSAGAKLFTGSFDRRTAHRANPMVDGKVYVEGPITIGNRCIVAANSVVLPNVTLSDDVLIGAQSLVKTNLKAGLYAGVPVRPIGHALNRTSTV